MANAILASYLTTVTPAFSFGGITTGAGRICTQIDNTAVRATRGLVALRVKTGAGAPSASQVYRIYLIRNSNDATNIQGGRMGTSLGAVDAAVATEPLNAELVGSVTVSTATATTYDELFPVVDPGPKFSFVVWNASGNTSDATNGNHLLQWAPIVDEVQ